MNEVYHMLTDFLLLCCCVEAEFSWVAVVLANDKTQRALESVVS